MSEGAPREGAPVTPVNHEGSRVPRDRSLFERLRDPGTEAPRTIHENTTRLADSVLENLRHLLNARHGVSPAQLEYGIPDLCDIATNFPEGISGMRRGIKTAIERYEPRLRHVSVKHVEDESDPLALRFEITAELVTEEERASVWFETRVDSSGEVDVKG